VDVKVAQMHTARVIHCIIIVATVFDQVPYKFALYGTDM